jgi:hypothetical protein
VTEEVTPALKIILRGLLDEGKVSEDWRTANVTPSSKKVTKLDLGNYRKVSLTSVCCKLLEAIIRDNLMDHLMSTNL